MCLKYLSILGVFPFVPADSLPLRRPGQAFNSDPTNDFWIPAFAGMTGKILKLSASFCFPFFISEHIILFGNEKLLTMLGINII